MSTNQLQGALQSDDLHYPVKDGYFGDPDEEKYYDDVSLTDLTIGQTVNITLESLFTSQVELLELRSGSNPRNLGSRTTFTVQPGVDYVLRVTSQNPKGLGTYILTTNTGTLTSVPLYQAEALSQQGQNHWRKRPLGQPITLTYSFMEELPSYYKQNGKGQWQGIDSRFTTSDFKPMTQPQRNAVELALREWGRVSGITFKAVPDRASSSLRFGTAKDSTGVLGWAGYPNQGDQTAGDLWLNYEIDANNRNLAPGTYGFSTIFHEIGHTLGLSHPFGDFGEVFTLPKAQSTVQYTVMAYKNFPGLPQKYQPRTPMLYDIAAIQQLYGKNFKTGRGDTVYRWQPGETFIETIYDAGGTDIVSARNQSGNVVINLEAGQFSSIGEFRGRAIKNNLAIAFGVTIEHATGGGGDDRLTGNVVENRLIGNSGADVLIGYAGNDQLTGGNGSDTFVFQTEKDGIDTITDFTQGNDTIDVSHLLNQVGYTGTDPFLDGVLTGSIQQRNTVVLFDQDGSGGIASATPLAILENFTDLQMLRNATKVVL